MCSFPEYLEIEAKPPSVIIPFPEDLWLQFYMKREDLRESQDGWSDICPMHQFQFHQNYTKIMEMAYFFSGSVLSPPPPST